MHSKNHEFKVGTFECIVIKDAVNAYENPVSLLFCNAPQEQLTQILQEHGIELEQWSEWVSPYICLLIKTGLHNVLVDTGIGSIFPPAQGDLMQRLKAIAIEPDDIDIVLITHAHGDHCGGNVDSEGMAAFKNARYIMHKAEWEFWTSENVLTQPQNEWMVPVVNRNLEPLRDRFDLIEEDTRVVPGVELKCAPGHTPGHMVVLISSGGEQLWYMSDAFLHPIHIEQPNWYAEVDIQPEQTVITRNSLLNKVGTGQSLIQCFHFPYPGLGHIKRNRNGYQWHPLTIEEKE
ncbi:MAG: MBL fold metallo-hydrolase [Candidatus Promineifilaceae bacterium]